MKGRENSACDPQVLSLSEVTESYLYKSCIFYRNNYKWNIFIDSVPFQ